MDRLFGPSLAAAQVTPFLADRSFPVRRVRLRSILFRDPDFFGSAYPSDLEARQEILDQSDFYPSVLGLAEGHRLVPDGPASQITLEFCREQQFDEVYVQIVGGDWLPPLF